MLTIDTPDLDQALRDDPDGTFHRVVEAYLAESLIALRTQLLQGLSPLEFEQARKLEIALEKAAEVVRFSAHLPTSR